MEAEKLIAVGIIVAPHGIRGEVRIESLSAHQERFAQGNRFLMQNEELRQELVLEKSRWHKGQIVAKFVGVDDREAAEKLKGMKLLINPQDVLPLPEGQYYHFELIGLDVVTPDGEYKGKLTDVLVYSANDVYVVQSPERQEYYIPALKELIPEIDVKAGRMVVIPREGLFE